MENNKNLTELGTDANTQDLINASQIFGRALGLIFEDREGIVIDVFGNIKLEDTNKVLVYKMDNQIHIMKCEQDIPDGTTVRLNNADEQNVNE